MLQLLSKLRCSGLLQQQQQQQLRRGQQLVLQFQRQLTQQAKQRPKLSDLRRLAAQSRPERWHIAAGIGLLAFSSGVTVSLPFFIGRIVDVIDAEKDDRAALRRSLTRLSGGLAALFLLAGAANAARVYLMRAAGQRIIKRMRDSVYSSTLSQEVAFFDRSRTGELVNRLSADTALVGESLTLNVADGMRSTFMAAASVGMMIYVCPRLAAVSLAVVPPVAVMAVVYGRYVKRISQQVQDRLAASTQLAEERLSGIRTVRAFAREADEIASYSQETQSVYSATLSEARARAVFFGSVTAAGNLVVLCVLYSGGIMMSDGQLSVGSLSAFLLYAVYVGISINGVSSFYSDLMRGLGASQRLWQLIDRRPSIPALPDGVSTMRPASVLGEIAFRQLSFSYRSSGGGVADSQDDAGASRVQLFTGLDLKVPAGSSLAIVGPSGSGKSTLGHLLLRFYDPDSGSVTLDGVDIRQLDPVWLRSQIGCVPQEPALFSCSVADNIRYGAADQSPVSLAEVEAAARLANAHAFISALPQGYDTLVGERGVLLSGGQRQRVAIARAIVKNPRVLLLDEATSALDAESEFLVHDALLKVAKGRTVITIAHRLSTIRSADIIGVLADGRLAELGSYSELMARPDGAFRRLIDRQTL